MKNQTGIVIGVIIFAVIGVLVYLTIPKEVHGHADFAVFIDGRQIEFSHARYMSDDEHLSEHVHLHESNGSIVHTHAGRVTWNEFFATLGIGTNVTCLAVNNVSYCNNDTHRLRMFANGKEIDDAEEYLIKDMDRVLITLDNGSNIQQQLKQVTDFACVYSNKCPERGEAAGESCVVGGKQCT